LTGGGGAGRLVAGVSETEVVVGEEVYGGGGAGCEFNGGGAVYVFNGGGGGGAFLYTEVFLEGGGPGFKLEDAELDVAVVLERLMVPPFCERDTWTSRAK